MGVYINVEFETENYRLISYSDSEFNLLDLKNGTFKTLEMMWHTELKDILEFVITNVDIEFRNGFLEKMLDVVDEDEEKELINKLLNEEIFIEKPLETKLGTFYISNNEEREHFAFKLYDSNKEWVANLLYETTIEDIMNIESIEDFVELGISDNAIWNNDLEDMFYDYIDTTQPDYETLHKTEKYELYQTFKEYVNKVGDTYFILDFDNI